MSASHYNNKKLAPFKKQRELLQEELRKLQQEYIEEEKLNDYYFDEIGRAEKDYELLTKSIEKHKKQKENRSNDDNGQTQGVDEMIEKNVISTLNLFLLQSSKKEKLQDIQEKEINKIQHQGQNLILTQAKPKQPLEPISQQQQQQQDKDEEDADGYYIILKQGQNKLFTKIPGSIQTFKELKKIVKSCCMAEEREIFYIDQLGNLLQDDMYVLTELYPPIYELLRNYQPCVGIDIVRSRKKDDVVQITDMDLQFEGKQDGLQRTFQMVKKVEHAINWSKYLDYLTGFKYFVESLLFVALLIIYAMVEINELDFFTNTQLLVTLSNEFSIPGAFQAPISNIADKVLLSIPAEEQNKTYPTFPLQSGLLVQTLAGIVDLSDCSILNDKQKQLFIDKNESCLSFDNIQTNNLSGNFDSFGFDSKEYNSQLNGYIWEFNMTNQVSFQNSYKNMVDQNWVQYNKKETQFILNYYNSPTQRIVQVVITTLYLFNDPMLNYNSVSMEAFNLSDPSELTLLYKLIYFYIGVVLLISSFFDFFGLYLAGTQNNLIVIYLSYKELIGRKKKLEAKKRELPHNDIRELEQKELIISEYIIIDLKIIFITIRIPLVFDYAYIVCQIGIVVKGTIDDIYDSKLKQIDVHSSLFQDTTALIQPLFVTRIFSACLSLFLMISIVRFLGNWSPYLKCYGLVMIRFNRQSWFLLFVLIYIIGVCAMSWSITLQGKLINHENFFYTFLGLLRCTLKYGMHNDISEQNLYNTYVKDISYSFETRYIQYLIVITISFIMIPIFISLMTEQVHSTKIEAKQKMLELQKQLNK